MFSLPEICRGLGSGGLRPGPPVRRPRLVPLAAAWCFLALPACAGRYAPESREVRPGWEQTGVASWYGEPFHGRATASGERYDQEGLTAAHKFLPFGTWVRVENLDNGRTVRVRITDRGPFVGGRIVDLSRAAARSLGLLGPGTARVRLEVVDVSGCHVVQVASFERRESALEWRKRYEDRGAPVLLESGPGGTTRVLLGPYSDRESADRRREEFGGWLRSCPDLEGPAGDG